MGKYLDEYRKAKAAGKAKSISRLIHTWEEEGQELAGKIKDITPFTLGKFDTEVNCYLIETEDGLVTTVLGSATDKQIGTDVKPGDQIYLQFKGKKQLDDGRQINLFEVNTW